MRDHSAEDTPRMKEAGGRAQQTLCQRGWPGDPHPQIALDAEITRTRRNSHVEGNALHRFVVYHFLSLASSHLIRTAASRMGRKGIFSSPISRVGKLGSKLVKRQEPSAELNLCGIESPGL